MSDEFDATIDRLMANRETIKEKVRQALRAKAEDFPPDSTARHFLWSHSYEAAEAALSAIEEAGYVIAQKEPMRSEDVFTGDDVENIAEWQEWASRTGNDQLAGMLRHWWKKAQKTAEALRSLKRSPSPTEETDV